MTRNRKALVLMSIAGTALGGAALSADASVFSLSHVLAASNRQIPGQAPGVTWGALNQPSVASDGRVLFSGGINGVAPANNLGIFTGMQAADVLLVAQSGTQAPGGPAGATMDLNGSSAGFLANSAKINADGLISCVSLFTGGGSVPNADNQAIFSGTASGGFGIFVRRGSAAPGTAGALLNSAFAASSGSIPINGSGVGYFASGLTGGDVVGTTNDNGIFGGVAGNLGLVARRGSAAPGIAGGTFGAFSNPVPIMADSSGRLVFGNRLNATGGVTAANDSVLYMHTPGSGLSLVAREGDAAPGTAGAVYAGSPIMFANNLNNAGQSAFATNLSGGDVVPGVNDSAIYLATTSGATQGWRKGMAAAGTDATFSAVSTLSLCIDNAGRIAMSATIVGGSSTTADDTGIWYGAPGDLRLIAREGSAVPTLNATFSSLGALDPRTNALGQLVFSANMLSSDPALNNKTGLFAFDPALGLLPLAYVGEQIEVAPGVFKTITGFQTRTGSNSDGAGVTLSDTGWLTLKVTASDATDVIVSFAVPTTGPLALLALGGVTLLRRRR